MMHAALDVLTIRLALPGCTSLKQKRSRLKPMLIRLQREFNVSIAELDALDSHESAVIGCACIANNRDHARQVLQQLQNYILDHYPENEIIETHFEAI